MKDNLRKLADVLVDTVSSAAKDFLNDVIDKNIKDEKIEKEQKNSKEEK